jgi:hypothetical protein
MQRIRVTDSPAWGGTPTVWRACVCLVLIASVLYNPFFALQIQSDGLAYASLARHRSTVGSSEMQHYPPVQTEYAQPDAMVEETVPQISVVQVAQTEYPASIILDQALPPQPELIASICFRPPPSL